MRKYALIRKVRLTTRVYGTMHYNLTIFSQDQNNRLAGPVLTKMEVQHEGQLINPRRMHCRVTVVVLSMCVCVYLLPRSRLHTSFIHRKQGVIGFFMVFSRFLSCGFC